MVEIPILAAGGAVNVLVLAGRRTVGVVEHLDRYAGGAISTLLVQLGKHAVADLRTAPRIIGGLMEAVIRMVAKRAAAFEQSRGQAVAVLAGGADPVSTDDTVGVCRTET